MLLEVLEEGIEGVGALLLVLTYFDEGGCLVRLMTARYRRFALQFLGGKKGLACPRTWRVVRRQATLIVARRCESLMVVGVTSRSGSLLILLLLLRHELSQVIVAGATRLIIGHVSSRH